MNPSHLTVLVDLLSLFVLQQLADNSPQVSSAGGLLDLPLHVWAELDFFDLFHDRPFLSTYLYMPARPHPVG